MIVEGFTLSVKRAALLLGAAAVMLISAPDSIMAKQLPQVAAPSMGVAWYPEQWPQERWDTDLQMMRQANIDWVRIAEFSWSRLEPREGIYRLDWVERAIRAAERNGLKVVIGTPSAAPPAWLTAKYPDVLRVNRDGRSAQHGYRAHFNWSSPRYQEMAANLARQLAKRFGKDPNVIGWQIDNEYDDESFGPADRVRFQRWLAARYGTVDVINREWTTTYWSQTYDNWSQVPIPTPTGANPGLALAWKRFVTDTWQQYQRAQLTALRTHSDPRQSITTNFLGLRENFDLATVSNDLDFASWDYYTGSGRFNPASNGFYHDMIRGLLRRNFWVMETQPGQVNWSGLNRTPERGELRAMAWSAVGHGADAIGYWQWRSALNGQEQYHGVLVGADGRPHPVLEEISAIGAEFDKVEATLKGTAPSSDIAVLHDYPSRWAWNGQRHHRDFDPVAVMIRYHAAARRHVRSVEVIQPVKPLSQYRVILAPALHLITPAIAAALKNYVEGGGHLVLGPRSGMKDEENSLHPTGQPGLLSELLGARVESFHALEQPVGMIGSIGGRAQLWADVLSPLSHTVEVQASYGTANGWIDGKPAIVSRRLSSGSITYVGADLDDAGVDAVVKSVTNRAAVEAVFPTLPAHVDVTKRVSDDRTVWIFVESGQAPTTVVLPTEMQNLLAGGLTTQIELERYGVAVLVQPRQAPPKK